jgi:hypothetical protein
MKNMLKIITWTAVIAGIVALPFLIRRRNEQVHYRDLNVRYDIVDYISEVNL